MSYRGSETSSFEAGSDSGNEGLAEAFQSVTAPLTARRAILRPEFESHTHSAGRSRVNISNTLPPPRPARPSRTNTSTVSRPTRPARISRTNTSTTSQPSPPEGRTRPATHSRVNNSNTSRPSRPARIPRTNTGTILRPSTAESETYPARPSRANTSTTSRPTRPAGISGTNTSTTSQPSPSEGRTRPAGIPRTNTGTISRPSTAECETYPTRPSGTSTSTTSQPSRPAEITETNTSTISWPSPPESFELLAEEFGVGLICRECDGIGERTELVMCSCGPLYSPVHRRCLQNGPDHSGCRPVNFLSFILTSVVLDTRPLRDHRTTLHLDDVVSTWIGVPFAQSGRKPYISVWSRLKRLLDTAEGRPRKQYPSLVSFIGDTGSGKSTLIRAMIQMIKPEDIDESSVPIPGLPGRDQFVSTSCDVHVYADPLTLGGREPIFFVDSEGVAGSEYSVAYNAIKDQYTEGHRATAENRTIRDQRIFEAQHSEPLERTKRFYMNAMHKIDIEWGEWRNPRPAAQGSNNHQPPRQVHHETRRRVAADIYPRLLYALSDVICYVTSNGRQSHGFLSQLLSWAKSGHDQTFNKPAKPALIIVINKEGSYSDDTVTSEQATEQILLSFESSSTYYELRDEWVNRGRNIQNARQLVLCYYESFFVIEIPPCNLFDRRFMPQAAERTASRIRNLYEKIQTLSGEMRKVRELRGAMYDVAILSKYLKVFLKSLCMDDRLALDFQGSIVREDPIPTRFSQHMATAMFNLLEARSEKDPDAEIDEGKVVEDFRRYVAACIVAQLPSKADSKLLTLGLGNYALVLTELETFNQRRDYLVNEACMGLEIFRRKYWRCEARDCTKENNRCRNFSDLHGPDHQFEGSSSKNTTFSGMQMGSHVCSWDPKAFKDVLWKEVIEFLEGGQGRDQIQILARSTGIHEIRTQRTCLTCLSNCPTNMLPCETGQHGLCETCIQKHFRREDYESVMTIYNCPLGCSLATESWSIKIKPKAAEPRILSLDGGGVRGIVELSILSMIEREVGFNIPIQELFDFVIGTSAGGIVALGVFHQGWSARSRLRRFQTFAQNAFSLRARLGIPIIKAMVQPFCTFQYSTQGIEDALIDAFDNKQYLFGSPINFSGRRRSGNSRRRDGDAMKIAVTTSLEERDEATLLTNYFRNPTGQDDDILSRAEKQEDDFKVWQAARATSAVPLYFKPYTHQSKVFVDGGIVENNPIGLAIEECKKIWPETTRPDIVVSVGAGDVVDTETGHRKETSSSWSLPPGIAFLRGYRKQFEVGVNMVGQSLDCYRKWRLFVKSIKGDTRLRQNCHRLNVGLSKRVEVDDVQGIPELATYCEEYLQNNPIPYRERDMNNQKYRSAREHIQSVARRLVSSLFYFSKKLEGDLTSNIVRGKLHCRLTPGYEYTEALISADGLEFRLTEEFEKGLPKHRLVRYERSNKGFDRTTLSVDIVVRATPGARTRSIMMTLGQWEGDWIPISGF